MRLRLLVIAVLVAVLLPSLLLARSTGLIGGSGALPRSLPDQDRAAWEQETRYLAFEDLRRLPASWGMPDRQWQVDPGAAVSPGRVRVLVVGDSTTAGHGLYDLDQRWPLLLEDELNRRTAPGAFEVTVLARSGSSTMEQAQWLESGLLGRLGPEVVVLGYSSNDAVPSGRERSICQRLAATCPPPFDSFVEQTPEYRDCLRRYRGEQDPAAVPGPRLDRACDAEEMSARLGLPTYESLSRAPEQGPYWQDFLSAVSFMDDRFQGAVHLLVDTEFRGLIEDPAVSTQPLRQLLQVFSQVPLPPGIFTRTSQDVSVWANPADPHPGPVRLHAMAQATADAIMARLPRARLDRAVKGAKARTWPLVSNFLPSDATVEQAGTVSALLRYTPGQGTTTGLEGEVRQWFEQERQFAPCALLGRPHARVMLDRHLPAGTKVRLELVESDEPLEVLGAGYQDGVLHWTSLGVLAPGEGVQVVLAPPEVTGFLVAPLQGQGCGPGVPVNLPSFSVRLTRLTP